MRPTVQVGAPRGSYIRDVYVHLLRWSWGRLLVGVTCAYLLANLPFAALYLARPGCVSGVDGWVKAFAFSVQTMSTIGYGSMSPVTNYAHVVVAAEAAFGMLFVALVTGLLFAKFSRPKANVLFSNVACVHDWHGTPTLSFRVANARGHEIIDASVRCSTLGSDVSPEGVRLRRLTDLALVRERTPMFLLSWSVMHTIDEASPLYGLTQADLEADDWRLIVTFSGIESTYSQMVHASHAYDAADIRYAECFVDVITDHGKAGIEIDYRRFHETRDAPLSGAA